MPCEEYTLWEMRCPRGWVCGKKNKLINKHKTRPLAVSGLACHLLDTHKDITTWNQALRIADDDAYITENTQTYEVPVEGNGEEGKGQGKGEPSITTLDEVLVSIESAASECENMARRFRSESVQLRKAKHFIEIMKGKPRSPTPPPDRQCARRPRRF